MARNIYLAAVLVASDW